jgi:hypothetical protein
LELDEEFPHEEREARMIRIVKETTDFWPRFFTFPPCLLGCQEIYPSLNQIGMVP